MKTLISYLKEVKDHRRAQGQRTPMVAFLEMIVLAGMSGHFGFRAMSRFIKDNEAFFVERYNLEHGTPTYTTLRNFTKELDYKELCNSLYNWSIQFLTKEEWIEIDGKAIRSTVTEEHSSRQNYKSMVSMFCDRKGIVINAISIENKKAHEGAAARELIEQCELKGITFTMDALHCQKKRRKLSWSQEMSMSF